MLVEVVIPFTQPFLAPFRKGDIFEIDSAEAKSLIEGGLVRPSSKKSPEYAARKSK